MDIVKIPAVDGSARFALVRGPILLAQDSRLGMVNEPVSLPGETPEQTVREGFCDVYTYSNGVKVCDYASAGSLFEENNTLCVWLKEQKN